MGHSRASSAVVVWPGEHQTIRRFWLLIAAICFAHSLAGRPALAAEPKQVMLLYSFGKDFKPWSTYATAIRAELIRQSPSPLDITEQSLVTARSGDDNAEGPFVDYLGAIFAKRRLDLIVAIGAPAADFVQRHRPKLFATTPTLLMAVDQRRVQYPNLTDNDAVVAVHIDYLAAVENILRVMPNTKNVTVVVGTSPIEQFWRAEIEKDLAPLTSRIKLSWADGLSFDAFLKQAASLPADSAIFWELMIVDAAGIVHEGSAPLSRLHAVANAPIFSYDESFFGQEIVGGPLLLVADSSRQAAAVAIRILAGEKPSTINAPPVEFGKPMFDWREMQRWGISEAILPPGSQIFFREPTLWSRYRWQLLAIMAIIFTEALLIAGLLYERRRRRAAEVASRQRLSELTHLNRISTAGELSASVAHEISQPLTALMSNASAALNWLGQRSPNLEEATASLLRVTAAGDRMIGVIQNLRSMFRKDAAKQQAIDLNDLLRIVFALLRHEMQRHDVSLRFEPGAIGLRVVGDQPQLEQVLINLLMNAIEAMSQAPITDPRVIEVETSVSDGGLLITIADSGPKLDEKDINKMFESFYTTKPNGMGMGLSICRSIIDAHGGRLWASPRDRGLVMNVWLPFVGQDLTR